MSGERDTRSLAIPAGAAEVEGLDELAAKATPGPWQARFLFRLVQRVAESPGDLLLDYGAEATFDAKRAWADCEFVVALVNAYPQLRATLSRQQAEIERLGKERDETRALLAKTSDGSVALQRHRDSWRAYAYGKREKPTDFLDGNMVDRGPTAIEAAEAEASRLRTDGQKVAQDSRRIVARLSALVQESWDVRDVCPDKEAEACAEAGELLIGIAAFLATLPESKETTDG